MDAEEIEQLWKELIAAKVWDLVSKDGLPMRHSVQGQGTQPPNDSNEPTLWLDTVVKKKLRVVISNQQNHPFVYLTPQQWLDWYSQLYSATIAIATLGAGFTFSLIFSSLESPADGDTQYVRRCIMTSWMLFVLGLGWSSFCALMVSVNRTKMLEELASGKKWYKQGFSFFNTLSILVAQLLPIGAFLSSAEAVRHYHDALGVASLALISGVGRLVVGFWLGQNR
ncbi:hypothetical protein LTR70_008577 [Exophiala xenobiotica]|nr:hypothetical protein LTR70_008577 [Exophiala xenobiotica]